MANNTKILKFNSGTEYDFRPFVNCTTEASTAIKSITLNGFTLFTGATIVVKFSKGNTANTMMLSINSSDPISVDYPVTDIGTYEFIYDGNKWRNLTVSHPYLLSKVYNQDFSTAYNETDDFIWCELGKLYDRYNSTVLYIVRSYPHTSYIFTISKGWGATGNITQLQACTSSNNNNPYIKGVRLLSDGTVEIKLNKPKTTLTNKTEIHAIAISSDIKNSDSTNSLYNELTLTNFNADTTTDISIIKSLDFSNNSIVADNFVGSLNGTASFATGLVNVPSIQQGTSDTNAITITAGGKTSDEFTVPYATVANNLQDIQYFEYNFTTNDVVSYLKIADLSDWEVTKFSNHYLIGNIYGNRGEAAQNASNANFNGTGIYNITAVVSSYYDSTKPDIDYSKFYKHQLYINTTANLLETSNGKAKLIEPCIIEHNGTKWLALKKIGSSCYIRFTGLMHNILPQDQWQEISQANCSEYATANYTDGYAITTEKYYDGNQINTLLHSNNYDETIFPQVSLVGISMNDLTNNGIYKLNDTLKNTDNLPIINYGTNYDARLTVLEGNNTVGQVLTLLNDGGSDTNIYTRTKESNGNWKPWSKLQTNVEVGLINQTQMDNIIDNGIYSGILSTTYETFVIICINNYAVAPYNQSISQLKYSLGVGSSDGSTPGVVKVEKRSRNTTGFWTDWEEIGSNNTSNTLTTSVEKLNSSSHILKNNTVCYISSTGSIAGFEEPSTNKAYTYTIIINGISPKNVTLPTAANIKWAGGDNPNNEKDAGIYEIIINGINCDGTIIYTGTWAKYE